MVRPASLIRSNSENGHVMQAPATNIKEDEVDCGIAIIPCSFSSRARFERLATPGSFLVCLIVLTLLLSVVEGYIYASAELLTTTFLFPPYLFDWLIIGNGLFQGLVAIVVAYWGKRIHSTAWLGGLSCLLGSFCLIAIIPYVASPSEGFNNRTSYVGPRLCERELSQIVDGEMAESGGVVMMITLILLLGFLSLASVSYYCHGLTYLDDNVTADKLANYIGIVLGIRLTNLSLGYSLMSLVSGSPGLWWLPFLILGILLLIVGTVIACFPLKLYSTLMKQTAASILDIASGHSSEGLDEFQVETIKAEEKFWPTMQRLITNRILVCDTLALSLFALAFLHFHSYEEAFLQSQFHISYSSDFTDPWTSRTLSDSLKAPIIILAISVTGLLFARNRLSAKKIAGLNVMVVVHSAVIFVALIFLDCKTSSIVGEEGPRYMTPLCSHDCRCKSSEVVFEPVCIIEGSQTYFSPCHAGCTTSAQVNNIYVYGNCTCGPNPEYVLGTGPLTSATRGACSANDCFKQWTFFQILYVTNCALGACTLVAHLLLALRCVRPSDKAAAVGFVLAGVSIIAYMPGHFIYKAISNETCRYWNADGYNCNLHSTTFADILAGVTAGIIILSAVLSVLVLRFARNLELYGEKEKLQPIGTDSPYPLDDSLPTEEEPLNRQEVNVYRPVLRTTQI